MKLIKSYKDYIKESEELKKNYTEKISEEEDNDEELKDTNTDVKKNTNASNKR